MTLRKEEALAYHQIGQAGKIEVTPTKPLSTIRDLSLAYSPGVAYPCLEIAEDVERVYDYTARGNVVAVISNGTAVLGLGNIGAEASKPVMEGKAMLFKKYAGIDGIDVEVRTTDPEEFITVVKNLEPSFGGINLEDIKAPECFEIETRLRSIMKIPVMHDDQHGTAMVSAAALLNALELTGRKIETTKMAVSGAGAAAMSCVRLYGMLGLRRENVVMVDVKGVVRKDRTDLPPSQMEFATDRMDVSSLRDAMKGADVFIGLSAGDIVDEDMIRSMNDRPIVFAMANPNPEIPWEKAMAARNDVIMGTGRSDYPNQVNNVLGFPYLFRGALDVRASVINEEMKLAAVRAIAALAREPVPEQISQMYGKKLAFGPEYLIPKPMDPRLLTRVSTAVAKGAIESGVARHPIADWEKYQDQLEARMGTNGGLVRRITQRAKNDPKRVVMLGAEHERVLHAARIVADELLARPVLVGERKALEARLRALEVDMDAVEIVDPADHAELLEARAKEYYEARQRHGVGMDGARRRVREPFFFAVSLIAAGKADAVLTDPSRGSSRALAEVRELVPLEKDVTTAAGMHIVNTRSGVFFFVDTLVNADPPAEILAEIGWLAARAVRFFGVTPRVAMLSSTSFDASHDAVSAKMARAAALLQQRDPGLVVDGDIQANMALRPDLVKEYFPFSPLAKGAANTFVFPTSTAANIAYKLVQELGAVESIGPVLLGIDKPVHTLPRGASVRDLVNMAAIATVDAQGGNEFF